MLLGAHLSIRNGLTGIFEQCEYLRCNTFQIFARNQLRWNVPPLKHEEVELFKEFLEKHGISKFVVHASYLLNISTLDDEKWQKSVEGLVIDLERAELLGAEALVLHPGSPKTPGVRGRAISRAAVAINRALEMSGTFSVSVAVENTAGGGNSLGGNLNEILSIIENVDYKERVGVCLDTAHAFQSGYTLDKRFLKEYLDMFGDRVYVIHLNDSKTPQGSKRDMHANIGEGLIPLEFFKAVLNEKSFYKVPKILETPGGLVKFKEDIEKLRSMVNETV